VVWKKPPVEGKKKEYCMKKSMFGLAFVVALVLAMAGCATANITRADVEKLADGGSFWYKGYNVTIHGTGPDRTLSISCPSQSRNLVIPKKIYGMPVTGITAFGNYHSYTRGNSQQPPPKMVA
jgi:hypothetical protein